MAESLVASVYGQALLETAIRRGQEREVWEEVRGLLPFFEAGQTLPQLLAAPQISPAAKKETLDRVLAGQAQALLLDFMHLLIDRHRTAALADCLRHYDRQAQLRLGLTPGRVVTARPLEESLRARLLARLESLTGKSFQMEWKVDPALLGGAVVRYDDVLLDGSLAGRLKGLEERLLAAPLR